MVEVEVSRKKYRGKRIGERSIKESESSIDVRSVGEKSVEKKSISVSSIGEKSIRERSICVMSIVIITIGISIVS